MAFIHSVFASIQGEGTRIGESHLFVRFCGCNLRCLYCDTPEAMSTTRFARIIRRETETRHANPISVSDMVEITRSYLSVNRINAISLTGGEPLMSVDFICEFVEALGEGNPPILLETNATLVPELRKVLPYINIVSADWKSANTGVENIDEEVTLEFLKTASGFAETFLKIPISESISEDYVSDVVSRVRNKAPLVREFILQPITNPKGRLIVGEAKLHMLHQAALRICPSVRVIPQMHKFMGIR